VLEEQNRGGRMVDKESGVWELGQMRQKREEELKIVMAEKKTIENESSSRVRGEKITLKKSDSESKDLTKKSGERIKGKKRTEGLWRKHSSTCAL
jgi:hypothetical protein